MRVSFILYVVLAASVAGCAQGPQVKLSNASAEPLNNVALRFNGGEAVLGVVGPGNTRTVTLSPRGESHLTLVFLDSRDKSHEQLIDIYFEPGYQGTLNVRVGPDLKATWTGNFRP